MSSRVDFLLEQGLSQEEVGRAVLAHPQVLHYKIDSMRERVDFLHNVGLTQVGMGLRDIGRVHKVVGHAGLCCCAG